MAHHTFRRHELSLRRWLTSSEAAMIAVATIVGILAGLSTRAQNMVAHGLQQVLYGVDINRLSALTSIQHPWKLLALPSGGLVLMGFNRVIGRRHTSIDVVEANALHGGRVPASDSWIVCLQTLISNGFGASVGLEAAYTQAGGALASVMAAALSARIVTRLLGGEGYLVAAGDVGRIATHDYVTYAILGVVMAIAGIGLMRLQTGLERFVQRWPLPALFRPVVGGLLLIPIAWISPQALSSGHGALRL